MTLAGFEYNGKLTQLKPNRNLPLLCTRLDMFLNSVIYPVAYTDADSKKKLESRPELSTDVFRGHFCGVHGNKDGGCAYAKARYDSTSVETGNGAGIDHLKNSAHDKHGRADYHGPPSAEARSDGPYHETPKKCTGLQYANGIGVDGLGLCLSIVEVFLKCCEGENSTNDSGIVGKQK